MLQFKGKLSLETAGADMMAVVSRRAIVVGSCPGGRQAQEGGDIVAYHSLALCLSPANIHVSAAAPPLEQADQHC